MSYNKVGINDLFNHVLLIDYLQSRWSATGKRIGIPLESLAIIYLLFKCDLLQTENVTITTFAGDTEMLIVGEGIAEVTESK